MKKSIIIIGASVIGLLMLGSNKVTELKGLFENLKLKFHTINKVEFVGGKVLLDISMKLINPTNLGTSLTELITIKEIKLFNSKGKLLAVSYPDISGIGINSNETLQIDNIKITGTLTSAVTEYLITKFKGAYKIQATIEVLGKNWIVS